MRGRFITVEGLDGAGKTTHVVFLQTLLATRGVPLSTTREPGGTPLGEKLRELLLLSEQKLHAETEALLMFAARREHLERVIRPALQAGTWVLCDRFTDASFAYQAGGSGVAWEKIAVLEQWVHPDLRPDLTLYLDVDPVVARSRARAVKPPDRFEQEQGRFHARVRTAYLQRAREEPARICVVDANRPLPQVQAELEEILLRFCNE